MPQALQSMCVIQSWSWVNSLFPLLALWGNKNWLPSMKVKKLENFQDKDGSKNCKWSSLNAPGTEAHMHHPYLELDDFPFLIISRHVEKRDFVIWMYALPKCNVLFIQNKARKQNKM